MPGKQRRNYEEELRDAVNRIGKKPESGLSSQNSDTWQKYLVDVLGIREASVKSVGGRDFWESVRGEIAKKQPKLAEQKEEKHTILARKPRPPRKEPWFSQTEKISYYTNPKSKQTSYRDYAGRWTHIEKERKNT